MERVEQRLLFAAGDLDPSFGAGGVAVAYEAAAPAEQATFLDVAAAPGRVYVAAVRYLNYRDPRLLIGAFDAAGRPDPTWAGDGLLETGLEPRGPDIIVQPGGKLLVGAGAPGEGPGVARYLVDGTPDPTFGGGDGRADVPFGGGMALAPGGKIVVAGRVDGGRFRVTRLHPDGSLDTSLGGDGVVELDYRGPGGPVMYGPTGLAVHPDDGRIVLVGSMPVPQDESGEPGYDGVVVRINPDGSYDTTLDGDGRLRRDSGFVDDEITAVVALADGMLYIAPSAGEAEAFPVRLRADGSDDPTFNAYPYDYVEPRIRDIHPTADGKVIVTGVTDVWGDPEDGPYTFMHRYNPDGSIDATFGGHRFHRPIGGKSDLDAEGRIVIGAADLTPYGYGGTIRAARYLTTGGTSTTVIQAEHGERAGAEVRRDHDGYTGTGYVDFIRRANDSVTWTVQAHSSGTHALTFRYANGSDSRRVVRLTVDEVKARYHVWFNPTGSWSTWRTRTIHVPLRSGGEATDFNRVTLRSIGLNGPNVDSLTVRRPTPRPPVPRVVEAEDGTLEGAAFVSTSNAGYTRRGYVDFTRPTGDALQWVLNSSWSGSRTARLRIYYANGSDATRSLRLTVNGQVLDGDLAFAPTGSWSRWGGVSVTVPLRFGDNTLRLEANGSAGPNIDRIGIRWAPLF